MWEGHRNRSRRLAKSSTHKSYFSFCRFLMQCYLCCAGATLSQLSDSGQTLSEDSGVDIAEAGGLSKDGSPRPSKSQQGHVEPPGAMRQVALHATVTHNRSRQTSDSYCPALRFDLCLVYWCLIRDTTLIAPVFRSSKLCPCSLCFGTITQIIQRQE